MCFIDYACIYLLITLYSFVVKYSSGHICTRKNCHAKNVLFPRQEIVYSFIFSKTQHTPPFVSWYFCFDLLHIPFITLFSIQSENQITYEVSAKSPENENNLNIRYLEESSTEETSKTKWTAEQFSPPLWFIGGQIATFTLARLMRRPDKPCINWGAPGLLENLPYSRTTFSIPWTHKCGRLTRLGL